MIAIATEYCRTKEAQSGLPVVHLPVNRQCIDKRTEEIADCMLSDRTHKPPEFCRAQNGALLLMSLLRYREN